MTPLTTQARARRRAPRRARARLTIAGACAPALITIVGACASDNDLVLADAALDADAARTAKDLMVAQAHDLRDAAAALCDAAPAPAAGGWSLAHDGARIATMKASWKEAMRAYQGLEGAVGLFFPDLAAALGARYEEALALGPDPDLLNGAGFVGLHAVERVLWADRIPASVVALEVPLDGYTPAAFPADAGAGARFQAGLCARLTADTDALEDRVDALALDSSGAYEAAARLVARQAEKLIQAGEGRDDSRYAGHTLADMGANVAAARATHAVFHGWLATKAGGAEADTAITDGFARLEKEYAAFSSDALPYVPADWSLVDLTPEALGTPFGHLYATVANEANGSLDGSLARSMSEAARLLGITAAK